MRIELLVRQQCLDKALLVVRAVAKGKAIEVRTAKQANKKTVTYFGQVSPPPATVEREFIGKEKKEPAFFLHFSARLKTSTIGRS